jgi:GNAT superfamily N-acetyltransferase
MVGRRLPGTALRVRRGRRRDLAQVERVLGPSADAGLARVFRRVVADLGTDLYVAEDEGGEIVGIVSVAYARSLLRGGVSAWLDGARARREPARPVLEGLVAFAEERARRRGCRRLAAWVDAGDAELRATLLARGYRPGDLLVTDLAGSA